MPLCCHLTRRQVLQWASLVAASPLLSTVPDSERAYAVPGGAPSKAIPHNLELVTLTESSAILTWFTGDPTRPDDLGRPSPAPADTEVLLGTSPARLRPVHQDERRTAYHYVELDGLEPGQTYFYLARSGGLAAAPAAFALGNPVGTSGPDTLAGAPFVFTTPQPPPGRFLFSLALCNDLHIGETVAGLATTVAGQGVPPGITQAPGEPPYTSVMAEALVREAGRRHADLLLATGDLSGEALPAETRRAKTYLDAFGAYRRDYFVVRGNHDRPHDGPEHATCSPERRATSYGDCFSDDFFPNHTTWFTAEAHGLRILGLDTYDKLGSGGDNGVIGAEQFGFIADQLKKEPDRPTLVFGHHPVTVESNDTSVPPITFDLDPQQARRLERMYASAPGVFFHHCAHTHRNKRTRTRNAPGVVFQETGATKEYPGGMHLLRVFEGGYAVNFFRFRDTAAREWTERSRQEYLGGYPYYTFGTFADRNYAVARDMSGLSSKRNDAARRPSRHPGDDDHSPLAVTGSPGVLPLAGAATLAAATAAEVWLRRARRN